ncbi:myotubularin-related protein 9 [Anthonomus grandis grandis]|uniref:myotubularin-related protein 9 n=1 Tax=Anthonomus grandis grandis TaxID=2921223 RepID=UPI0021654D69|nr:myotubularin-related protein 9 [Anthonomus grandis grandis]
MEFIEFITIPKLDGVILHSPFQEPIDGTLCITGHHLILSTRKENVQELWLLIQAIDAIEKKQQPNAQQNSGSIILKCKDLRQLQLDIPSSYDFQTVYTSIERLANLERQELLYPFFYRPMYNILEDGYTLFRPETEYSKLLASDEWRISYVNQNFSVCRSYNSVLVVPKCIDDNTLIAAASFREGGRFPLLSYRCDNGAVLMRCSQPLTSNSNKRCRSDERILNSILGPYKKGYIIDTRSPGLINHYKSKGGGTEPDGHYPQWNKIFKNLDKLVKCDGSVLEHFSKLIDACNDTSITTEKWLSRLESSHWLTHVQNVLSTACLVAQCLDKDEASVLVHGSSGLDSTLLVTSVAQVILNPDCRTVRGLQALIEREWLQAGHPFQTRHSNFCYSNGKTKGQQPTFLLFLDCIHQLHYQFPYSFEFTTQILILIFENSYFSNFGTFMGNNECERQEMKLSKTTTSFWSYLNRPDVITKFLNPMYEPNKTAIWPSIAPVSLQLWSDLYLRWIINPKYQKSAKEKMHQLIERDKDLRSKVIKMRKQLIDLQKELQSLSVENEDELDD